MCTAINFRGNHHLFGRNLDMSCSPGEAIVITPRNHLFSFSSGEVFSRHYTMIGTAFSEEPTFPLYYDAVNEKGLCMAGLRFPRSAEYHSEKERKRNLASFELIPFVLSLCGNLKEAKVLLKTVNITQMSFSDALPTTPLHWLVADQSGSFTVEATKKGLVLYDNPFDVLTNEPPFPYMAERMRDFARLSPFQPENNFGKHIDLTSYSKGMGGLGMPGDWSSVSRFVRAAFLLSNSPRFSSKNEAVSQFFHLLSAVEQPKGAVQEKADNRIITEQTAYSSCCDSALGVYYYKTYDRWQLTAVDMHKFDLEKDCLYFVPMLRV